MKGNDRIIFAIGLAAFALLLYSIFPKIGLTFDSHLYLRLAENLDSKALEQYSFGSKPPLYPALLYLLQNNLTAISIFNILCWLGSSILMFKLFVEKVEDHFWRWSLAAILFMATPMLMVHNFVWTEPPFILLIFCFLYLKERNASKFQVIGMAMTLLLVVALKHLGIAIVLGFALTILWKERNVKKALFISSPSILFFILWQVKSFHMRGNFSRLAHTESLDILQNLNWVGQMLWHWMQPLDVPAFVSILTTLTLFALLCFLLWKAKLEKAFFLILPLTIMSVVITKGDLLQPDVERYFSLVYPCLVFLILHSLSKTSWSDRLILKIPVLLFVAYSVIRAIKNGIFWHSA